MQQLWEFGGRSLLIAFFCSALLGAVAGYALASFGRYSRVVGVTIGALFSLPGVIGLFIAAIARVSARKSAETADARPVDVVVPAAEYVGFASFGESAPGVGSAASSGFGFDAYDEAPSYTSFAAAWDEVEPEPVALTTAGSDAARSRWDWIKSRSGLRATILGAGAAAILAATLVAAWLSVDAAIIPRFWIYPIGTGLDLAVVVSIIVCATALLFVALRPYRWAAVLLAVVADSWLFFALMVASARQSVAEVLTEVGALSVTVGDTLAALGVETTGEVLELPPGVDLTSLGITGRTINVGAVELGTAIPDVTVDLGPAVYMLIAFAVLANVAAVLILVAAHALSDRQRATRNRSI